MIHAQAFYAGPFYTLGLAISGILGIMRRSHLLSTPSVLKQPANGVNLGPLAQR